MSFDINYDIPTIITKRNVDSMENPIGVKLLEKKQVMDNHSCIVLSQIPDENYRITIEGFNEVFNSDELGNNNFYVSYSQGVVHFSPRYHGKTVVIEYYGIGYELISASRVFYKYDKRGNVIETLEEILDNAKEQLELIKTLGDSVRVIEKLEMDLENGKVLHDNLENDIEVGTPLQENLHSDIVEAKKWKDQLHQDVTDGKVLQPLLQQTVDDAEDVKVRLDKSIADAQEDIATIEATGNKEILIQSSQWRLNSDVYEKEIAHDLNSENLHVTAKNSDTKEAVTIGYKILDKTRILLKSDEAINMSVILSASYYHATQTISDNISEEVVKSRKGEVSLDVKITKIDEQLDNNVQKLGFLYENRLKFAFGAKGDGVTDDSEAIKNAIEYDPTLIINNGTYLIGTPILFENINNIDIKTVNSKLVTSKNVKALTFNNCNNLSLSIQFDLSTQFDETLSNLNNVGIYIKNCNNVKFNNNKFYNGCMGVIIERVNNLEFMYNDFDNFKFWGNCLGKSDGGYIKNATVCFNKGSRMYDGLKLTGILENVEVFNNICTENIRDGIDYAGHSALNVKIHDNSCKSNTLKGIEFKTLLQSEYSISNEFLNTKLYFKDIYIYNNNLSYNENCQLDIALNTYGNTVIQEAENINIGRNTIKGRETGELINNHDGIRLFGFTFNKHTNSLRCYDNIVDGLKLWYGIRVINCSYVVIEDNSVRSARDNIYLQSQSDVECTHNKIIDNVLNLLETGYCVLSDSKNNNIIVNNNKAKSPDTTYRYSLQGSIKEFYNNIIKDFDGSTVPVGRATKGEIAYSIDPITSGCLGWICTGTSSSSTWSKFGLIA